MRSVSNAFDAAIKNASRFVKGFVTLDFGASIDPPYATVTATSTESGYSADQVVDGRYLEDSAGYTGSDVPTIFNTSSIGWMSAAVTDATRYFAAPQVLTITYNKAGFYTPRVCNFWLVGTQVNYPTDFTIEVDSGSGYVIIATVVDNTDWLYNIQEASIQTVVAIRITITRTSLASSNARVIEAGLVYAVTFESDDITEMSGFEQTFFDNNQISKIMSGQFMLTLRNKDACFMASNETSPYYGLMSPSLQLKPYLGVEVSTDIFESVPMGVFYNTTWQTIEFNSMSFHLDCYDYLDFLNAVPYTYTFATTQQDMDSYIDDVRQALVDSSVIPASKFANNISTIYLPITYNYSMKNTLRDFIEEAIASYPAMVKVSRLGVVSLENFSIADGVPDDVWTDDNLVIATKQAQLDTTSYSSVEVTLHRLTPKRREKIIDLKAVEVAVTTENEPYTHLRLESNVPILNVESVIVTNNSRPVSIQSVSYGHKTVRISLSNPGAAATVDIAVYATVIQDNKSILTLASADWSGVYTHELKIDNIYHQNEANCNDYMATILGALEAPDKDMTVTTKYNPATELHDRILVTDYTNNIIEVNMQVFKQSWKWDGTLSGEVSGRVVS